MLLRDTKDVLSRCGVVWPTVPAGGFPILTPLGTGLVQRLVDEYLSILGDSTRFVEVEMPCLIDLEEYKARTSVAYDYQNVYVAESATGSVAVRPDNLPAAVGWATGNSFQGPVVTSGSFYRAETGATTPLVRDRHIWRVVQVVQVVRRPLHSSAYDLHRETFLKLCRRLCLATLGVDALGLRRHSSERWLAFATPHLSELTLICTLYQLSQELSTSLGTTLPVIDFGFTNKMLAVVIAMFADRHGLVLPSALAPVQIRIVCQDPAEEPQLRHMEQDLRQAGFRTEVVSERLQAARSQARRSGIPLLVSCNQAGEVWMGLRVDGHPRRAERDVLLEAASALTRQDDVLYKQSQELLRDALEKGEAVTVDADPTDQRWHPIGVLRDVPPMLQEIGSSRHQVYSTRKRHY